MVHKEKDSEVIEQYENGFKNLIVVTRTLKMKPITRESLCTLDNEHMKVIVEQNLI